MTPQEDDLEATRRRLSNAMRIGQVENPDALATDRRQAESLGVSVGALRLARQQGVALPTPGEDLSDLPQTAPRTTEFLSQPANAGVAHDAVRELSGMEGLLSSASRVATDVGRSLAAGVPRLASGLGGLVQAAGETARFTDPFFYAEKLGLTPEWLDVAGSYRVQDEAATAIRARTGALTTRVAPAADRQQGLYGAALSGVQSIPQSIAGLAAGIIAGPSVGLTVAGGVAGGEGYAEGREEGLPVGQALTYGAGQGAAEVVGEAIPMARLINDLKVGTPFFRALLRNQAQEQIGEQVTTVLQDLNEWANLNPEKTIAEFVAERPGAAAETAVATLVGSGATTTAVLAADRAARRLAGRSVEAQVAEADSQRVVDFAVMAEQSVVRQRDVATFEQFVAEAAADGPVENLYVDAQTFAQTLEEAGVSVEEVAAAVPAVGEQLANALATGGDLSIPVEQFAARIAGTDASAPLLDHMRVNPSLPSRAETAAANAQDTAAIQAEAETILVAEETDAEFKASAERVRENFVTQLNTAGRFTPDVNKAYAGLVSNFYTVQAARLGITPEEMAARYPLRVASEAPTSAPSQSTMDQVPVDVARGLNYETRLPEGPELAEMSANTEGAELTAEGLRIDLSRWQRPEQEGAQSVRTGVFYLPSNSKDARHYRNQNRGGGTNSYGGTEQVRGETLLRAPLVVKGATGGKAPEVAYDTLKGKGAYEKIMREARSLSNQKHVLKEVYPEAVYNFLEENGADGNLAWDIIENSKTGNQLPYALVENIVAHAVREAGYDSVVGYSKTKSGLRVSEVFDVREAEYPGPDGSFGLNATFEQRNRGQITFGEDITQSPSIISLLQTADLSTFLHELGHFFLEVNTHIAAQPDAPADIAADLDATLNWFRPGMTLAEWNALPLEEKRPYHEQFARGFEAFLFEGKAPTTELRTMFQKFRSWLLNVYRDITNLNVELTDEVRDIMGRMLASAEAIKETEDARAFAPLLDAKPEGMTDDAWAEYQRAGAAATEEGLDNLSTRTARDMQWLSNAKSRVVKELQRNAVEQRKAVRAEVTAEVREEPIYRARQFITRGTDAEGNPLPGAGKLDLAALKETYGTETTALWRGLKTQGRYAEAGNNGIDPDAVAEQFGYESGDALVRGLISAEDINEKIAGLTDQRMLERYGDVIDEQSLDRAANEAVANSARVRFVATEMAIVGQMTGQPRAMAAVAREAAAGIVNRLQLKRNNPAQFLAAQTRASKAADKAMRAGDTAEVVRQKRFQLINLQASRYAMDAQKDVDKAVRLFTRIVTANDDALAKSRDMNLVNAARAVLASYGVGRTKNKPEAQLELLKNYDPTLYADLIPVIRSAAGNGSPITDLTYEQFQGVRDAVNQLWSLSRRTKQVEIDGKLVQVTAVREELMARLDEIGLPEGRDGTTEDPSEGMRFGRQLQGVRAALRRVESWTRGIDGGDTGPFRRYLWNPVSEGADRYRVEQTKILQRYLEVIKPIEKTLTKAKVSAPEIGHTFGNKSQLIHAILHTGNLSNKSKLLLGRNWGRRTEDGALDSTRWDGMIDRMIADGTLTKADFDVAQEIWDLLDSMKAGAQAAHKAIYGRYFAEVTADAFDTPFGTYRGGYVPALTDGFFVQDAVLRDEQRALEESDSAMFPAASNGFTKSRVEDYTRELALDLRLLPMHMDKVLKFTHLGPPVRDVARVLKGRALTQKMHDFDPVAQTDLLLPWLQRAATQQVQTPSKGQGGKLMDNFARQLRSRVGMQLMFANVSNTVQQVTGFSSLLARVDKARMRDALWRYARDPKGTADAVAGLSNFMASRTTGQMFEARQAIEQMLLDPNQYEKARDWTSRHGYFMQSFAQNMVDTIGWAAAYDQAVQRGDSDLEAVRFADSVVRETQGSMAAEDVARFETGNAFQRLFTQFVGYFNTTANLNATEFQIVQRGMGIKEGMGRLTYVYAVAFAIPALAADLIAQAFRGELGDEDDDGYMDDFLAWFFGSQAKFAVAMVPGGGAAVLAAAGGFTEKPFDDKISLSPSISVAESSVRAPSQIYKTVAEGESFDRRDIRDTLTLLGVMTGLPLGALGRPVGYVAGVAQGDIAPTGPVDFARGLVTGTPSPESKVPG